MKKDNVPCLKYEHTYNNSDFSEKVFYEKHYLEWIEGKIKLYINLFITCSILSWTDTYILWFSDIIL